MKKYVLLVITILLSASVLYAIDTNKPDSHNANWLYGHGNKAKMNDKECFVCHEERVECIACHEDTAPRNHTTMFVKKTHGLKVRWDRTQCVTCHKEDFCDSCHEIAMPLNHNRAGFRVENSPNSHCLTGCQRPVGDWKNTAAKNCIFCHKTRPVLNNRQHP